MRPNTPYLLVQQSEENREGWQLKLSAGVRIDFAIQANFFDNRCCPLHNDFPQLLEAIGLKRVLIIDHPNLRIKAHAGKIISQPSPKRALVGRFGRVANHCTGTTSRISWPTEQQSPNHSMPSGVPYVQSHRLCLRVLQTSSHYGKLKHKSRERAADLPEKLKCAKRSQLESTTRLLG